MYRPGVTVWYNVSNMERTLEFFVKKLGFEVQFHDPDNGMAYVGTNTQDCSIGFSEVGPESVVPSTSSTVFEVENLERAVAELKDKGVTFVGEIEDIPDMVKLATFVDPDGHNYMLAETAVQP